MTTFIRSGCFTGEGVHRAHACVEIENLPERDVQRTNSAADGSGQRTFDGYAEFMDSMNRIVGQPSLEFRHGFLARKDFIPAYAPLAPVRLLHGRVKHSHRSSPDVSTGAVAFDKWNDGIIGHLIPAIAVVNPAAPGYGYAIV
jgi:hypothetical protein